MSIFDRPLSILKEAVFAETDDAGKVSVIMWDSDTTGTATVHVPCAAFDRFPKRAALRAIQIKIPTARRVTNIKSDHGLVKYPNAIYYLIRADFATK